MEEEGGTAAVEVVSRQEGGTITVLCWDGGGGKRRVVIQEGCVVIVEGCVVTAESTTVAGEGCIAIREGDIAGEERHVATREGQPCPCRLPVAAGTAPQDSSFLVSALMVHHYQRGAWYPRGGASEVAFHAVPVIERAGGAVLVRAPVTRVLVNAAGTAVGELRDPACPLTPPEGWGHGGSAPRVP